jgi:hypothetical protein
MQRALLVVLALGVMAPTCGPYSWKNFSGTQQVSPEYMAAPTTPQELIQYVTAATQNGKRIRMTGSGHSHSDVAVTNEALLTPTGLVKPLVVDTNRLKQPNRFGLVRVESGITIRALNTYLDTVHLALQNMGGYDAQTIIGACMTGTHGSGIDYGPLADQIVSMQVVGEGGTVYQIEPKDGITKPNGFPGTLEGTTIPVTLIQDDDVFNAMRVSFGTMGIVYSVTLQTDPKFWLNEYRTLMKWADVSKPGGFLDRIIAGQPIDDSAHPAEHYEFQFNPYPQNGDRSFLLTRRTRYYTKPAGDTVRGQPLTDALQGFVVVTSGAIAAIANTLPAVVPLLLEQAVQAQVDDNGYVNDSYNVFNIGKINETKAIAVEIGFDVRDIRTVLERAFQIGEQLQAQGLMQTAPSSVRFVNSSDAMLSMAEGRPTAVLEIIVLTEVNGHEQVLKTYEQTLMNEFGGRLHWGLDLSVIQGSAVPAQLYPRWNDWLAVYRRFNKGTFDGAVTDRLGISVRPR